jgi:hypothetical protein
LHGRSKLGHYRVACGSSPETRSPESGCGTQTTGDRSDTWKGYDWQVMNSLHEKGYISNPATKAKSVAFTGEGAKFSKELFEKLFALK